MATITEARQALIKRAIQACHKKNVITIGDLLETKGPVDAVVYLDLPWYFRGVPYRKNKERHGIHTAWLCASIHSKYIDTPLIALNTKDLYVINGTVLAEFELKRRDYSFIKMTPREDMLCYDNNITDRVIPIPTLKR